MSTVELFFYLPEDATDEERDRVRDYFHRKEQEISEAYVYGLRVVSSNEARGGSDLQAILVLTKDTIEIVNGVGGIVLTFLMVYRQVRELFPDIKVTGKNSRGREKPIDTDEQAEELIKGP